jgi:hypothetical protein
MKMEVIRSSETSVHIRTKRRDIPEDINVHNYRCENLIYYISNTNFGRNTGRLSFIPVGRCKTVCVLSGAGSLTKQILGSMPGTRIGISFRLGSSSLVSFEFKVAVQSFISLPVQRHKITRSISVVLRHNSWLNRPRARDARPLLLDCELNITSSFDLWTGSEQFTTNSCHIAASCCTVLMWLSVLFRRLRVALVTLVTLSHSSSVGMATGYGLGDREVGARVAAGSRIFTSPYLQDRLFGPPNFISNG